MEGGSRGGGDQGVSGQHGCEPKIEVIGEMQKKSGRGPVGSGRSGWVLTEN